MIAYVVTREQAHFPTFHATASSSYSTHVGSASGSGSASGYTSIEDGTSITVSDFTNFFTGHTATNSLTFDEQSRLEFGATTTANATGTSATESQTSFNSFSSRQSIGTSTTSGTSSSTSGIFTFSTSDSASITETFGTTTAASVTLTNTVTTSVSTTSTHYTVSSGSLTTATTNTDVLTSTSATTVSTTVSETSTSSLYATYIEFGAFISSESNDWLWRPIEESMTPNLVTDFCATFAASTFWPVPISVPLVFLAVDSTATTSTIAIGADSVSYSYQQLYSTTTEESTITKGDSFSRDTTTHSVAVWTTTTAGTTVGNPATTVTAASTTQYSTTTNVYAPDSATVLYPVGVSDSSTTQLVVLNSSIGTTTLFTIVPGVVSSFSSTESSGSTGDGGTSVGGFTQEGTDILYKNYGFIGFGGLPNGITPIAPYGAFVAGSDLKSSANPYNFASNLSFSGGQIVYPALASVFSNAQTPFPGKTSVSHTDSITWLFSWTSDTLKATKQSTFTVGTSTHTTRTTTSGTFSSLGDVSTYYADGGSVFGGFPYIESSDETVYYPPRAVLGTSISTDGSSTTYRLLATDSSIDTISETVVVENQIPAYQVYTYGGPPNAGDQPFLDFERN